MASGTINFRAILDMAQRQIINAVLHVLGSDPGSPVEGQFWYNSTDKRLKYRTDAGPVSDTDRARHTGTQTASTISDFTTARDAQRLDQHVGPTSSVGLNNQKLTSVADPTADQDAANKRYVDATVHGLSWHEPVRAATTANITNLAGGAPNATDGVTLAANDRILVKDQTTTSLNGIYTVTTLGTGANGTWTRATDADAAGELEGGSVVYVLEGTVAGDKQYSITAPSGDITPGTTAHTWSVISSGGGGLTTAGAGLTSSAGTVDVGAGTGIAVAADSVGIDTAVVARKFKALSTAVTAQTVTHNLNNDSVVAAFRQVSDGDYHLVNYQRVDANSITVNWITAPTAGQFEVIVVG